LQAREFQVAKSQKQQGQQQQQQNQRNQSQIDQLDLKQQENNYETERQATAQQEQDPAKKEQMEQLNRLKELAQRQQDINEKLKELQTALQEAKTEKEKEDIQRELKRLREEQREMLADMDEMKQRMDGQSTKVSLPDLLRWTKVFAAADGELRSTAYRQLPLEMALVEAILPPTVVAVQDSGPVPPTPIQQPHHRMWTETNSIEPTKAVTAPAIRF
jgi:DNA repair exonuclease SbcCD ATPase subunit